jgi:hypothetical protein
MAHKLAIIVSEKPKYDPYCIPKPEGFEFTNDEHAKNGEYITVKVCADGDDKLKIVEIEGLPTGIENDNEDYGGVPDMTNLVEDTDNDGE